jgi:hypothetical protein
MVLQAYKKQN